MVLGDDPSTPAGRPPIDHAQTHYYPLWPLTATLRFYTGQQKAMRRLPHAAKHG